MWASLNVGITGGCNGHFWVSLYDFVSENGDGCNAVGAMACRDPFGLLFGSSFLSSMMVVVNFGTPNSCFCFLNTLGLSFEIHLLPFFISASSLLSLPFVHTSFKCAIPKKFQVPPFLRRGYSIAKPNDIINVGEVDKGFEVNRNVWWRWHGFCA